MKSPVLVLPIRQRCSYLSDNPERPDLMKKGFTLVELMIVVSIIGIMAGIALPLFQDYMIDARESAAKDNLHNFRNVIEVYAAKHNDAPPGYPGDDRSSLPDMLNLLLQLRVSGLLSDLPKNPFNKQKLIKVIDNETDMPAGASGENGWIYKPSTRQFRIDWPGKDSKGVRYYDY